jgi:hypothetical protein
MNITSTRPTEHTKDMDKSEDKALAYTEEIVQVIHTVEEDIRKAKKIKHFDRRSAMFMTNQATS